MHPSAGHSIHPQSAAQGRAGLNDGAVEPATNGVTTASGTVLMTAEARELMTAGKLMDGDALALARTAGIAAAKQTAKLVPLRQSTVLGFVDVEVTPIIEGVSITATVVSTDHAGAETHALAGVMIAALAVIDIVKVADPQALLGSARVTAVSNDPPSTRSMRTPVHDRPATGSPVESSGPFLDPSGSLGSRRARRLANRPTAVLAGRRALIVTVSTSHFARTEVVSAGRVAAESLATLGAHVDSSEVPEPAADIRGVVEYAAAEDVDLVVTIGGIGVGPGDLAPETLSPLVMRRMPGIEQAVRAAVGTPAAAFLRVVVGVAGRRTVVIALPGSDRGVRAGFDTLDPLWEPLFDQLEDGGQPETGVPGPPVPEGLGTAMRETPAASSGNPPVAAGPDTRRGRRMRAQQH